VSVKYPEELAQNGKGEEKNNVVTFSFLFFFLSTIHNEVRPGPSEIDASNILMPLRRA